MDSVIMTTPSNSMRLRSRLRSAANTICARTSRRSVLNNKMHQRTNGVIATRNIVNRHHQTPNRHGNINLRFVVDNENNEEKLKPPLGPNNSVSITREVYNAWCSRLGEITRIPNDSVQALFNDMQLYPSKTQVVEMLQCARQCGRRNSSQFLTFGEFCVFAGELRRNETKNRQLGHQHNTNSSQHSLSGSRIPINQCEVFLGGSCNPTTWRADTAIPTLKKFGITYYNPQVSTWSPELMAAEYSAKESAIVLFFVVDSQTRCIAGMLEVAYLVAKQRCVVLVVDPYKRSQVIMGETLSAQEFDDLSEGQSTLLTLVRSRGVTVHSNLTSALQCTVNLLRGSEGNTSGQKLSDKLLKLREVFDSIDTNHSGELTLSQVSYAYYQLTGSSPRISDLYLIMNLSQQQQNDVRITFEQFCGIVAEFTSTNGCHANGIDDWINGPIQRQPSNNNTTYPKAQNGFHSYGVYLGGSYKKHTTWRQDIAIPLLKRYAITYYNPSLHENTTDNPMDVIHGCKVVVFVITNETRSITSMILAAYYIASRKNVVLCVQQLPLESCVIGEDVITKQAIKDYNRARAYLKDLAKHENVPTFDSVQDAVECAINLVQPDQQNR